MRTVRNVASHVGNDGVRLFGDFYTSSKSQNTNCVEVGYRRIAGGVAEVALRDSKDRLGPAFVLNITEYRQFIDDVTSGAFDWPKEG